MSKQNCGPSRFSGRSDKPSKHRQCALLAGDVAGGHRSGSVIVTLAEWLIRKFLGAK